MGSGCGVCEDVPMFVRRNVTVTAVVGALALSACGASSGGGRRTGARSRSYRGDSNDRYRRGSVATPTEAEPAAPPATEARSPKSASGIRRPSTGTGTGTAPHRHRWSPNRQRQQYRSPIPPPTCRRPQRSADAPSRRCSPRAPMLLRTHCRTCSSTTSGAVEDQSAQRVPRRPPCADLDVGTTLTPPAAGKLPVSSSLLVSISKTSRSSASVPKTASARPRTSSPTTAPSHSPCCGRVIPELARLEHRVAARSDPLRRRRRPDQRMVGRLPRRRGTATRGRVPSRLSLVDDQHVP